MRSTFFVNLEIENHFQSVFLGLTGACVLESQSVHAVGGSGISLERLEVGQSARILNLSALSAIRARLLALGFVPGAVVRLDRSAPLGGPLVLRLQGARVSLRRKEASKIRVHCLRR
jgi:Fe2+ transport system protein FeoA